MNERFRHLSKIRYDMRDKDYRVAAATIITNHYIELYKSKRKPVSRTQVMKQVNKVLLTMGFEPMSYGFFRNFI